MTGANVQQCDLQWPRCGRCVRGGVDCSGRKENTIFVHHEASQSQRQALIRAYKTRTTAPDQSFGFYDETLDQLHGLMQLWSSNRAGSSLTPNFYLLCGTLNCQVYAALLAEFQPNRGQDGIFSADRQEGGMRHHSSINLCIRALVDASNYRIAMLDNAILSLLMLYYGRLHGNQDLVYQSRTGYAKVLADYRCFLAKALSDESGCCHRFRVAAHIAIALQLFEHVNEIESFKEAQLIHIDGALNLLKKCGPEVLKSDLALRKAFSGLRGLAIFTDLGKREPSFLSQREWIELDLNEKGKPTREELLGLALRIPGLLKSADDTISAFEQKAMHIDEFADKALHVLANMNSVRLQLDAWNLQLKKSVPGPLYWPRSRPMIRSASTLDNECKPKRPSNLSRLIFPCGPVAGILAQYWAFNLELLMTSTRLYTLLMAHKRSVFLQNLAANGLESDSKAAVDCARLILEAQPYLFSCFEGVIALQPPLTVATRYYKGSVQ